MVERSRSPVTAHCFSRVFLLSLLACLPQNKFELAQQFAPCVGSVWSCSALAWGFAHQYGRDAQLGAAGAGPWVDKQAKSGGICTRALAEGVLDLLFGVDKIEVVRTKGAGQQVVPE